MWRRLAEIVERYVHKGDKLYIEGELRTRNYTDKKGVTHYVTEIWANNMEMLTPKSQQTTNNVSSGDATSKSSAENSNGNCPF